MAGLVLVSNFVVVDFGLWKLMGHFLSLVHCSSFQRFLSRCDLSTAHLKSHRRTENHHHFNTHQLPRRARLLQRSGTNAFCSFAARNRRKHTLNCGRTRGVLQPGGRGWLKHTQHSHTHVLFGTLALVGVSFQSTLADGVVECAAEDCLANTK